VLKGVLRFLDQNPTLDNRADINPKVFLSNLYYMISPEELLELKKFNLCFEVMSVINSIASHNSAEIRSMLKALGFFDIRDSCLIWMLRREMPSDVRAYLFGNFSFESVSATNKFREGTMAIIYMVKILVEERERFDLQMAVLNILRDEVCEHLENRRFLSRRIEFKGLLDYIFAERSVEPEGAMA
jgi:hypothetical protein